MRKQRISFYIAITLLALIFSVGTASVRSLWSPVILEDAGLKFKIKPGESFHHAASNLYHQGVLPHPYVFLSYVMWHSQIHQLKAGEYLFLKGSTPISMLHQMITGTGLVQHTFTIIPGWTFRQVRNALKNNDELIHSTAGLSEDEVMKKLGYPSLHAEGQFYPDTYSYVEGVSDLVVLKKAFIAMQEKFNAEWAKRDRDLPFKNPQEALVAASIIEKEADVPSELPIIAGVLENRLHRDMLLQFDPTVIYGVRDHFNGTIYRRDLLNKNPYNTYVNKGLPPTPISMPSLAAIRAVLHPDRNNYLYFVARGDGVSHQFSRTLADHYAAVAAAKKYRPWFFNYGLVKQYLMKMFATKIYNIE